MPLSGSVPGRSTFSRLSAVLAFMVLGELAAESPEPRRASALEMGHIPTLIDLEKKP